MTSSKFQLWRQKYWPKLQVSQASHFVYLKCLFQLKFSLNLSKSLQIFLLNLFWDPKTYLTNPNSSGNASAKNLNWLYLSNSLQISCNSTFLNKIISKDLVFISYHRKSQRILENIFCPRSIISSPNSIFPQKIPFFNKLQGSTILYLTISIDY